MEQDQVEADKDSGIIDDQNLMVGRRPALYHRPGKTDCADEYGDGVDRRGVTGGNGR